MLTPQRSRMVILVAVLSGCSTMQITSDYDPSANFADLRSYNWIPEPQKVSGDPKIDNPFIERRIRDAVDKQLAAQGYEKRSSGTPDFLIGYQVAIGKKLAVSTVNNYYGYGVGAGWHHRGARRYGASRVYVSEAYVYEYDQGSLVIDVVDPETQKLIWRGSAQAEVDRSASREKREKRISKAVQKILAGFPPKPK